MAVNFMEIETSIAANTVVQNVFSGERFERLPFDAVIDLAITGSATGLVYELNIGGRSVNPRTPTGTANRSPLVPDDVKVSDVEGFQGELVQLTVENTSAGALTVFARVIMEEAVEEVM